MSHDAEHHTQSVRKTGGAGALTRQWLLHPIIYTFLLGFLPVLTVGVLGIILGAIPALEGTWIAKQVDNLFNVAMVIGVLGGAIFYALEWWSEGSFSSIFARPILFFSGILLAVFMCTGLDNMVREVFGVPEAEVQQSWFEKLNPFDNDEDAPAQEAPADGDVRWWEIWK